MTIIEIKNALDEFARSGGDVNKLGNNDLLYRQIKDSDIFEDGKRLSVAEKFERAGYPRTKKPTALERIKKLLDDYADAGGDVFEIRKGMPIYLEIKNTTVRLEGGKRATLLEKFRLCGYDKRARRAVSIEEITRRLAEYVEAGGNIDDLGVDDELYQLVKKIDNKHTLEEKFKMCGQVRSPKKVYSATETLEREVHEYLASGGSFHIPRKSLPFYDRLHSARRSFARKNGRTITSRELLESLGIKGYSDTYYDFQYLFELEKFKDKDGYVDSYRKDKLIDGAIDRYAEELGMPISLVVILVADQKLKRCVFQTDALSYISNELKNYINKYGSFENISMTEPQLYDRLSRLKRVIKTESGKPISTKELVEILGSYDEKDVFSDYTNISEIDYETDILPLIEFAKSNGNMISAGDIPKNVYRYILDYASRNSTTIEDIFAGFGVNYKKTNQGKIHSKLYVGNYPYIDEMKTERDKLMEKLKSEHPEYTKEEFFEEYLEICKAVYGKYKGVIEKYGLNPDFDSSMISKTSE